MRRFIALATISALLAPAALAWEPEYASKLVELSDQVDEASREIADALKVDDYAAACASSRREAKLMNDYAELAFLHREALYSQTNMTPEQLEIGSNEKVLPLILTASRMRVKSAELCSRVSTTD